MEQKLCGAKLHPKESPGNCAACAKERRRRWVESHPDAERSRKKRWNDANRQRIRGQAKIRPSAAKANEYAKRWRDRNPEKVRANVEARRALKLGAPGSLTADEWRAILKKWGNKCALCGKPGKKKFGGSLTKDHIVPLSRGGTNYAHNIQPAHRSCNARKNAGLPPGTQHSLFEVEERAPKPQLCRGGRHPKNRPGKCQQCAQERRDRWKAANPEKDRESHRAWNQRNPEVVNEAARRYREKQKAT